jgi:hypothetical protein
MLAKETTVTKADRVAEETVVILTKVNTLTIIIKVFVLQSQQVVAVVTKASSVNTVMKGIIVTMISKETIAVTQVLSHLTSFFICKEIENCDCRVVPGGTASIPDFIQICPVVLGLNHSDGWANKTRLVCSFHIHHAKNT